MKRSFPDGALIAGPKGEILAVETDEAATPRLLYADLRAGWLLEARADPEYQLRYRRPELYRSLAE
ncbi:MAG: hypothetical protein ACP5U2_04615 [Bryobacteraceae bacterium]